MYCPITGELKCKCDKNYKIKRSPEVAETLRKLFAESAVYIKFYIDNSSNQPALIVIIDHLIQIQNDIANYLKKFIGNSNGTKLNTLFVEHISTIIIVIKTLKTNDKKQYDQAIDKLFNINKQCATFIKSINSHILSFDNVLNEYNNHKKYVIDLASNHYKNEYEKEYIIFDAFYNHMIFFYDFLSNAFLTNKNYENPINDPLISPDSVQKSYKAFFLNCPIFTSWGTTV